MEKYPNGIKKQKNEDHEVISKYGTFYTSCQWGPVQNYEIIF